jgi:ketosteroid isomerase-like protein
VHCAAAGAFRGDSLRQAFEALCRLYPAAGLEVLTLVIDGDRAAVRVLASLTFAPTGEPVSTELAHFWLFENDRPVEIVEFVDTAWAAQLMLKIA